MKKIKAVFFNCFFISLIVLPTFIFINSFRARKKQEEGIYA